MTIEASKKCQIAMMMAYFTAYLTILITDHRPLSAYGDVIELAGIGLALLAFVTGIRAHVKNKRLPWICFTLTALSSLLGEGLWSYYDHVLGIDPGSPSLCDVFFVSCILFCITGIIAFLRRDKSISIAGFSADLIISLVAAAGLIYIFLIFPAIQNSAKALDALILQISYPVFDFGILFGCLVIFFNAEREGYRKNSFFLMVLGFIIVFIADQLNLLSEVYDFDIVTLIEPLWPLSYCLLGISCIMSAQEEAQPGHLGTFISPLRENVIELLRMLVPYAITFSALGFIYIRYQLHNFVFYWAMFLLVILSIRQVFMLLSNKRLNRELRKLNLKATREAQIDFLTKLANRRHIDDVLAHYSKESENQPLGLLFIDIDLFKTINDTFGHDAGDKALCSVADAIRLSVRDSDIAGRFGGDEFIVILPGADAQAVTVVGERIRAQIRANQELASLNLSLSFGGASMLPGGDLHALLKSADKALYAAKEAGRDRLVVKPSLTSPKNGLD